MAMAENKNLDVMLGAAVVDLMNRPDITEIYNNDDGFIRYQSNEEGKVKSNIFLEPEKIQAIIELVAGQVGNTRGFNAGRQVQFKTGGHRQNDIGKTARRGPLVI